MEALTFLSILFERSEDRSRAETAQVPAFFRDLNLDQIVDAITASKEEYNLKPLFYTSLHDVDAITYRHEVLQDLENPILFKHIDSFAQKMRTMRAHLTQADKLSNKYQKQKWFLDAVEIYCSAVHSLAADVSLVDLKSRGLLAFRDYLITYLESDGFVSLLAETQKLHADLSTIKYCILIKGDSFKVRKYESESDYSSEVEETFAKFKQGAVKDYRVKFSEWAEMNHIEEKVLEYVALLYPDVFSSIDDYCLRNAGYLDKTMAVFDREIQFYIAYLEHAEMFKRAGQQFCYPEISDRSKDVYNYQGFDLALAYKLRSEKSFVVCNDFYLKDGERILVVSGPNQGGKTTFARAFGQLHYLTSLGCPVPGREARLFLFDQLFTHFEREEDIENLRGKLQDDIVRIHQILSQATSNSIIILNEIFTSTTLQDEIFLSERVMEKIIELGLLCVWVTFVDELASFGKQTVSMVSTVFPEDPTLRTFKILRRAADGLSYAMSIAEKYRLTRDHLNNRLKI
ncbi:MAG: DNA mismatch repair protein MutS [Chthoniobacterales bacterium]